jgi:hypothetical protein
MPDIEFINPASLLSLTPKTKQLPIQGLSVGLGPSAPHVDEGTELLEELSPGSPPMFGAGLGEGHYTNVLDEIWPEFDAPEERTAARLKVLLDETIERAERVHHASLEFFERVSFSKISLADRTRFRTEFIAYLRRLREYQERLDSLPKDSLDTASVYVGLVQQRSGAGPVPDAIMHLYFANQIDVLAQHVVDMSEGFVADVIAGLEALRDAGIDASDAIRETADEATDTAKKLRWAIFAGIGTAATVAVGAIVYALWPSRKEPT